jgi:hypothetical protein
MSSTGIPRPGRSVGFLNSPQVSWRPVGAATAVLGATVGAGTFYPILGWVIALIAVIVMVTVIGTALFGSHTFSERAFRLLRWFGNRPEPAAPGGAQ